jgi:outer membrane protein
VQRGRACRRSLVGSASKITQDEVLGGNQTLDTVGVQFTWPLFQGGAVASAVRQSRAQFHQAQANYEAAQRDAERRRARRFAASSRASSASARRAARWTPARLAVDAMRRNVEFGTGTEFELLDAQNNYYAAGAPMPRRATTT